MDFTGNVLDDLRSKLSAVNPKIDAYFEESQQGRSIVIFYFAKSNMLTILTLYRGINGKIYGQPTESLDQDAVPPKIFAQVDEIVSDWVNQFSIKEKN